MSAILTLLAAFKAGEWWARWLVAAAMVAALLAGAHVALDRIRDGAAERERAAIERSNRKADDDADAYERRAILCQGTWNRERRTCVD